MPNTLSEIRTIADKTFSDFPISYSVTIEAAWGLVTVYRDGRIVDGAVEN